MKNLSHTLKFDWSNYKFVLIFSAFKLKSIGVFFWSSLPAGFFENLSPFSFQTSREILHKFVKMLSVVSNLGI